MRYATVLLTGIVLPGFTLGAKVPSHVLQAKQASTVDVDLSDLSNTVNALVTTLEGVLTAVLTPVANGQASISGDVTLPGTSSSLVHLQLDVTPEVTSFVKRQTASDCTLGVLLSGQNVLNVSLDSAGGQPQTYTTQDVPGSGSSLLSLVETCGNTPVNIDLANLVLIASPQSGTGSSSTSTGSGSSPTGSSGTGSGTGSSGTGSSGTGSSGSGSGTGTGSSGSGSGSTGSDSNNSGSSGSDSGNVSTGNGTSSSGSGNGNGSISGSGSESQNGSGSSVSGSGVLPVSRTSSSATPTSSTMANPSVVNNYNFYACVGSAGHFPSFTLAGTNDQMTVEMCTSLCGASYPFAGLHDMDCYCGTTIDGATTAKVSTGECNIPCPGDAAEVCGGTSSSASSFLRRQVVSDDILLTVFVNVLYLAAQSGTVTVVSATTGIVTTSLTVAPTSSLTATSSSASASASATCTTGYCGSGWMFQGYPGDECAGEVVFVVEECSCEGGWSYQPKQCTNSSCAGETVFKPTRCTDNECEGELIFETQSCSNCAGGICYIQIVNQPAGAANASASASAGAGSMSGGSRVGVGAASGSGSESAAAGAAASAAAGASGASASAGSEAEAEASAGTAGSSSSASASSGSSSSSVNGSGSGSGSSGNQTQSCGAEGCKTATVLVAGSNRLLVDSLVVGLLVFVAAF